MSTDKRIIVCKTLAFALLELHPTEETPNHGEIVDEIITAAGGDIGEAWCVDTVNWLYQKTNKLLGLQPDIRIGRSTSILYNRAKQMDRLTTAPKDTDICLLKSLKHTTMVWDAPDSDGNFWTIEGNAGDTVKKVSRNIKDGYYFITLFR